MVHANLGPQPWIQAEAKHLEGGVATLLATHNPVGLIVSSGVKVVGEATGRSTIEGRADQTAKEIADQLRPKFEEQGWVYPTSLK
jgi:hypothetical protein